MSCPLVGFRCRREPAGFQLLEHKGIDRRPRPSASAGPPAAAADAPAAATTNRGRPGGWSSPGKDRSDRCPSRPGGDPVSQRRPSRPPAAATWAASRPLRPAPRAGFRRACPARSPVRSRRRTGPRPFSKGRACPWGPNRNGSRDTGEPGWGQPSRRSRDRLTPRLARHDRAERQRQKAAQSVRDPWSHVVSCSHRETTTVD